MRTFRIPGRRGRFALTLDVAQWLATRALTPRRILAIRRVSAPTSPRLRRPEREHPWPRYFFLPRK